MKDITKVVIALVIGGTIYTVNQADIVDNFSKDTGLSQQEAQEYVENVSDDELLPFDELGDEFISDGEYLVGIANEIDCINYEYEWESYSLTCSKGKSQIRKLGRSEIDLGESYKVLATEDATEKDISLTINNIDNVNANLKLEIVTAIIEPSTISESRNTNSYNKALLQAALDSQL